MTNSLKHTREVVKLNSAQCLDCLKILTSTHRHDYRTCGCPNGMMVDGGLEYIRRGAKDFKRVKDLSIIEDAPIGCSYYSWEPTVCWRCRSESYRIDMASS